MEVKLKFNDINVKEEKEKTLVKILMLKGEKGDTVSAEWGTITGNVTDQTDLKNALDNKANNSDIPSKTSDLTNDSGFITKGVNNLTNYYTKNDTDNKLKKKVYYFDTVALMKSSIDLSEGDMVITKGYYSANDGGAGEYEVIDDNTLVDDGGLYHETTNGLFAKLISKEINVKQFGAKGDGVNDDTIPIQKAINKCKEVILNNGLVGDSVVIIPGGKYKITSTITTYPYIRLKTSGSVIITTAIDDIAIKLDAGNDNLPLIEYNLAYLIDGTTGLRIENTNSEATSSIGLSIVNYSVSNRKTSNFTIKSIAFNGFKIATKVTNYNLYIIKFEDVTFGGNTTGIQFGDSTHTTQSNSGENIVFTRCIFVNTDAVKFYYGGQDCNFFNCSFDYCDNIFNDVGNKGYRKIFINGGHIETIRNSILNTMKYSILIITGCRFFVNSNISLFGTTRPCDIILNNNAYSLIIAPDQNPAKFIFPYDDYIATNNMMSIDKIGKPFGFASYVPHHTFDNAETGSITYQTNGSIGSYQMTGGSNIGSIACLDTNIFDTAGTGKIIQVTKNDTSAASSYLRLRSDYIPVNIHDKFRIYICGKNCFGNDSIGVSFYDQNKTLLKTNDIYIYNSGEATDSEDYKMSLHYATAVIPNNASFIRISYNFGNNNSNTETYEIAGIFVEKY